MAVRSALAEPETGEVIVIDDCSTDATVDTARAAGGDDSRLSVLVQDANRGPAAARNRAIDLATMPFVAVLDSDDRFMSGRMSRLFSKCDWDFCADNIAFTSDRAVFDAMEAPDDLSGRTGILDLETFFLGNHNSSTADRNELGFLKPIMRRDFLDRHGLRYPANCRLGEDFLLYGRALVLGARFRIFEDCGYAAFERPDSLSGKHGVDDLQSFLHGLEMLAPDIPGSAIGSFEALERTLKRKIDHRTVLDIRRSKGLVHGVLALASRRTAIADILRDKLKTRTFAPDRRVLMSAREFDRIAE